MLFEGGGEGRARALQTLLHAYERYILGRDITTPNSAENFMEMRPTITTPLAKETWLCLCLSCGKYIEWKGKNTNAGFHTLAGLFLNII